MGTERITRGAAARRCPADWVAQRRTRRGKTKVDQTVMRGLVTAGPVFVLGLRLSQSRGSVPPNHIEGCPDLPPRPPLCNGVSPFPFRLPLFAWTMQLYAAQALGCAMRAMAQTNAAISRAIATTMTFVTDA